MYIKLVLSLLFIVPITLFAQNDDCVNKESLKYDLLPDFQYFEKHGICLDSMKNIELYKNIYHWIGTRYKYGGRSKKGVDCSGFVKAVLDSTFEIKLLGGSASISKEVRKIEKSELREGDLLFFYSRGRKRIGHIAIYLGNNKFAHAACGTGVTISDLDEQWYAKRYVMAGRIDHLIPIQNNQASHSEKLLLYK